MADDRPWSVIADGIMVTIRLTPKGGRDAIERIDRLANGRTVVRARVCAAPSEGAANAALIRLMAEALDTPARNISVASGTTARVKQVKVLGNGSALAASLERRLTPQRLRPPA
jgi:uncharacterized protein YggU (UPF0235/DUF167 family)